MRRGTEASTPCPSAWRARAGWALGRGAQALLLGLIAGYQTFVSPWLGPRCRYWPRCSDYGLQAVGRWGALRGSALTFWRILRCNPWLPGGIDEVPERPSAPAADLYLACVLRQRRAQAPSPDHR